MKNREREKEHQVNLDNDEKILFKSSFVNKIQAFHHRRLQVPYCRIFFSNNNKTPQCRYKKAPSEDSQNVDLQISIKMASNNSNFVDRSGATDPHIIPTTNPITS